MNAMIESPDSEAFRMRFRAMLDAHVQAGRLPWSIDAAPLLLSGTCIGVRVPGGPGDELAPRAKPPLPGQSTQCRVLLFPGPLTAHLALDPDTPPGWVGTPYEVCMRLWPLVEAGEITRLQTVNQVTFDGICGALPERVALPGAGPRDVYCIESRLLGVYR